MLLLRELSKPQIFKRYILVTRWSKDNDLTGIRDMKGNKPSYCILREKWTSGGFNVHSSQKSRLDESFKPI